MELKINLFIYVHENFDRHRCFWSNSLNKDLSGFLLNCGMEFQGIYFVCQNYHSFPKSPIILIYLFGSIF